MADKQKPDFKSWHENLCFQASLLIEEYNGKERDNEFNRRQSEIDAGFEEYEKTAKEFGFDLRDLDD